ncbi:MAG: histidine phosphatase family protein [Chloroflexi bacterium]|nr:MAG: histidine phosphatase family protein [Chloroflexota bacterium]MBL1195839.1 histidine phosphatase family protein [Chloroflexota bacterium]NOH13131.1 histidine phosphatase family protein [Chloroflexota bacterium]
MKNTFTLVRHGQSTANAEGVHQGKGDFPLTDLGRQQAKALAAYWQERGQQFDGLIASPLLRTQQTAEILAETLDYQIEYDALLEERDVGQMSGLRFEESHKRFPLPEVFTPYFRFGIDGESEWRLHMRAGRALQNLMQRLPGHYLIVSHGGLMNRLLLAVLGTAPQANFQGAAFTHTNTAHSRISFDSERQRWQLDYSNDASHLDEVENQEATYQFLLVRHAQSEGNAQGLFQGLAEYDLSAKELEQADKVGERIALSELEIDGLVSSPQSRAMQTAEAIASKTGLEISTDDRLAELDMGDAQSKTHEQLQGIYPQWPHTGETLYQPMAQSGESVWGFYLRAGELLGDLLEKPPGRYIVVSHGGTLNAMLYAILGIQHRPDWRGPRIAFENASLSWLNYTPEHHTWRLIGLNDRQHLSGLI